MALSERLALLVTLDGRGAVKGFEQVGRAAEKNLGKSTQKIDMLGKSFTTAGVGMIATGAALAGGLFKMAQASEEAQLSVTKLENSLANNSGLAGATADEFVALSQAIQGKTAADGDNIVAGIAVLAQGKLNAAQIKELTPLVVDLARKKGIDEVSAFTLASKAVAGNAGALVRQGIAVDAAAFKTDAFGATVEALNSSVGGFADSEGKTFAGSITRLKNELGDLAEGVGVGVVDAFTSMLKVVDPLISSFTGLDPAVQGAAGKFAAFGAAGLLAAGLASTLIGSLIKMRQNFGAVADGIGFVIGKMKLLSIAQAGTIVGLAALAAGLVAVAWQQNAKRADELAASIKSVREESEATGKSVKNITLTQIADAFASADGANSLKLLGIDIKEIGVAATGSAEDYKAFITKIESTDLGITEGLTGGLTEKQQQLATATIVATSAAEQMRAVFTGAGAESQLLAGYQESLGIETDGATDATDGLTGELEAEKTAAQEAADALDVLSSAIRRQYDEATNAIDAQRGYQDALRDVRDGLKENGKSYDDSTESGHKNVDMLLAQQNAIGIAVAQAAKDGQDATLVQAYLTEGLRQTMLQGGLTQQQVQSLLDTYGFFPPVVPVEITAETKAAALAIANLKRDIDEFINSPKTIRIMYDVDESGLFNTLPFAGAKVSGRKHGGPVSRGTPYIVGEKGPELFVPNQSGQIIPNGAGGSTLSAGKGGVAESPLWRMIEFGKNIVEGLAIGFRDNSAEIAMQSLAEAVDNAEMRISSFAKAVDDAAISNLTNALTFADQAQSTVASVPLTDEDRLQMDTTNLLDTFGKLNWGISAAQAQQFIEDADNNWLNLPAWMLEAFRQQGTFFEDFGLRMDNDPRGPYLGSRITNPWGLPPGSIDIFAREHGGPTTKGKPYIVGERGPELFVPNQSGQIIPNGQGSTSSAAAGGNQTIVVKIGDEVVARVVANAMATGSRRGVG